MALVFMNLLLGLAVSDIAELERVSCVSDFDWGHFTFVFTVSCVSDFASGHFTFTFFFGL